MSAEQIQQVMRSNDVQVAASHIQKSMVQWRLTPQQQCAVIALLAARQVSVFPEPDQEAMVEAFTGMIQLGVESSGQN